MKALGHFPYGISKLMDLSQLEQTVDPVIFERGLAYYKAGSVVDLHEDNTGQWDASVLGSEEYFTSVVLEGSEVVEAECDCPYDWGRVCKHMVAVLLAVRERIQINASKPKPKKKPRAKSLAQIVKAIKNDITVEDLLEFIQIHGKKDKDLKNAFVLHFAHLTSADLQAQYRSMVKGWIKSAKDRYGYIDYRKGGKMMKSVIDLVQKARDKAQSSDYREALAICQVVIAEIAPLLLHMDSSSGDAGGSINWAFEIMEEIVEQMEAPEAKEKLFRYCMEQIDDPDLIEWDYDAKFLVLAEKLVMDDQMVDQFLQGIDRRIQQEKKGDRYSDYKLAHLTTLKIGFLTTHKPELAQALREDNLKYPEIRKMEAQRAIEAEDFERAKQLVREGIALAEQKKHPGTVNSWQEVLLQVAELEGDVEEARRLAEYLFWNSHRNFEYYRRLKGLFPEGEWGEKVGDIIERLKGDGKPGTWTDVQNLGQVFVEEAYWDRLFNLLALNPHSLFLQNEFAAYLLDSHAQELAAIRAEAIRHFAAEKVGRPHYKKVVKLLQELGKMEGGLEARNALVAEFRTAYRHRPAMMEEIARKFK